MLRKVTRYVRYVLANTRPHMAKGDRRTIWELLAWATLQILSYKPSLQDTGLRDRCGSIGAEKTNKDGRVPLKTKVLNQLTPTNLRSLFQPPWIASHGRLDVAVKLEANEEHVQRLNGCQQNGRLGSPNIEPLPLTTECGSTTSWHRVGPVDQ